MHTRSSARAAGAISLAAALLWLGACQTVPTIRTQSAPNADLGRYRTYEFFATPSTDAHGYKTITTRTIEDAVDRELGARGLARAGGADLKVNFNITKREKITSTPTAGPAYAVGVGGWRSGYGWGLGMGTQNEIQTVTEGTLTIDLVDAAKNELVWSGSASRALNAEVLDQPAKAIDQAVRLIFARYPAAALPAAH